MPRQVAGQIDAAVVVNTLLDVLFPPSNTEEYTAFRDHLNTLAADEQVQHGQNWLARVIGGFVKTHDDYLLHPEEYDES